MAGTLRTAGISTPSQVTVKALTGLPGVAARRADRLYTAWIGAGHLYSLAELLVPLELPARWASRLVDLLGDNAADRLREDPWRLLGLPDVTVAQADRLAREIEPGVQRDDPRRGRSLVDWTLARFARQGHTVCPLPLLADALRPFGTDAQQAFKDAVDAELVSGVLADGQPAVARRVLADAEEEIAFHIGRLADSAVSLAGERAVKQALKGLDEVQSGAVTLAAAEGVSLLTGGPGTGKSRTVAAIVALCTRVSSSVALAAPTGRAAKRLEELTGHPATTIHRLLGARRPGQDDRGAGSFFEHDEGNPIEADLVVVDEASMLDVELCAALLAALPDRTHLVIVGDPAQLPSIGPGRVLADLIDSGTLPVTELTKLYRQEEGGAIARLATAVRGGELPAVTSPTHEVVVVPCRGSEEAAHRVVQLVTDSIPRVFGASGDQLQVVTPVHKGPAGTQSLNKALKARLNPGNGTVRGFDVGDRVVATANHLDAEPTGFANGEVGTVVATGDNSVRVAFTGGESEISGKSLNDLLHGWAITVHRAQGSEWDAVVAVMPPEAGQMLSRPLVYTALTRARKHLSVAHAAGPALARAVHDIGSQPRRTRLEELLRHDRGATADGSDEDQGGEEES
ncbi:AAA family ATPase [Nakamurella sp. YIM 132087]|uniref:AAA family ATPase n=1 Tax=Nakamurella alba TaxID=2665158 RepID=A0A7K1FL26_9ACTN|nr:AAA family ATPase [Nakamurella alba]